MMNLPYAAQLARKEKQVRILLDKYLIFICFCF